MSRVVSLLLALATLLWALGLTAGWLWGQGEDTLPPDVLMIQGKSCRLDPQAQGGWRATGTVTYLEHENYHRAPWSVVLPVRKNEPAANKDCLRWFQAIEKLRAATRPVDVKQFQKKEKP